MTQNTSATGGTLVPEFFADSPAPLYDDALDAFFQPIIAGISGMTPKLVIPRWQVTPVNLPAYDVTWAAMGITVHDAPANAAVVHQSYRYDQNDNPDFDDGHTYDETPVQSQRDVLQTQEELEILMSIYGPTCRAVAAQLRDGFQIAQNRETLMANAVAFVSVGKIIMSAEQVNNQWHRRADVILYFRRSVVRTYPVLDLVSSDGDVQSDAPPVIRAFDTSSQE